MATLDYARFYDGSYDNITNTFTVSTSSSETSTSWSDQNGNNNGIAEVNEILTETSFFVTENFVGYHEGGILNTDGSNYYFYTNNVYSINDQLNITTDAYTFCFPQGTLIATPAGSVPIETLSRGDDITILTPAGKTASAPVKFLHEQRLRRHPFQAKDEALPIRIAAGALGQDQPSRDLFVSPDHALLVDGCLVHAAALINGRTIMQLSDWDGELVYYHIETDAHDLILAEGTPAETFIDNVSRERFDNHAEYQALYPEASPMVESELPRVKYARQLPMAIRRRLEAVADALLGREQAAA